MKKKLPSEVKETLPEMRDEAADGKLSRRAFLRTGAAVGGGLVAAGTVGASAVKAANPDNLPPNVPEWSTPLGNGVTFEPYGVPSEYEANVKRRMVEWLTPSAESSVSFSPLQDLHGSITPNGLFFERHHGGVPEIDPEDYRLMINGLVDREMIFTLEDLKRFPSEDRIHFVECAANGGMEWHGAQLNGVQFTHGMVSCSQWTGVTLKTLFDECGVKPEGKWVLAEGSDAAGMTRSIPVEKMLDDCMVVYAMNGEALRPEQGYPVRLLVPGYEGNMNVKWLRRLEIGDQPWYHREETSKYTDLMPDGKARLFTYEVDANSVITFPCAEKPLKSKGYVQISGLAWSGRGKVARVDVSVDGGKNWKQARITTPIYDKAMVRFKLDWEWNGEEVLLQSRVTDETGYIQPTFAQLRKVRGSESIYHNNAIHTWRVNPNGEVENVQVS